MEELARALYSLQKSAARLLTRADKKQQIKDEWARLELYLDYRLSCAQKLVESTAGLALSPGEVGFFRQTTPAFIKWCKAYNNDYKNSTLYRSGFSSRGAEDPDAERLLEYGKYADAVSELMKQLGDRYFVKCRQLIKKHLNEAKHVDQLPLAFHGIRMTLPHNVDADLSIPRIWPRPEGLP
jgi:hypothetical protein